MTCRLDCPLCHGEGCLEDYAPGGYFDAAEEAWHPLEVVRECGGSGIAQAIYADVLQRNALARI